MAFSVRKEFHSDLATLLLNEIQYQKSAYYYFLGKPDPWSITDEAPLTAEINSSLEDTRIRTNALYFKKISPNEVTLVTKRYNWVNGRVYAQWDHTKDMSQLNFYCYTVDGNGIFKCLDNNGGSPSTVEPTGKSFLPFRTSDGYLWKYMYTVPSFKRKQFASSNYIPVQRALTDSFYNRGSIEHVGITNAGTGYTSIDETNIVVSGGTTTGSGAVLSIDSFGGPGSITGVSIVSGGSGYTLGARTTVTSLYGFGAEFSLTFTAGVLTDVEIISGGYGYTTGDTVNVVVGGCELFPVISRIDGSVLEVKIINPGAGYLTVPTVNIVASSGTPSGAYPGNPGAILTPIVSNGKVVRVLIPDPGKNYPVDTNTKIIVSGDGTGATFSPVIKDGSIIDVIIDDAGTGYTNISMLVTGAGTGATLVATISASDFVSEQSIVEQTAVRGAIHAIQITEPGEDYSTTTTMLIEGDGSGAAGHVITENGKIIRVVMTSYGSDYTYANVVFSDPNRFDPLGTKVVASGYAIFPPGQGHGADSIVELYADTLAISTRLQSNVELNLVGQDFRQFGLMRNPRNLQTGILYKGISHLSVFEVLFQDTSGLVLDELLQIDSTIFRVIWFDSERVMLQRTSSEVKTPIGELTAVSNNLRSYVCYRVITQPVLDKYSGNLLYVTSENPFVFSEDQGILVKTFIKL